MINKKKFYINGKWVDPSKPNDFQVINPSNEEIFAIISLGYKEDTDLAVKSAKKAFVTWKETSKEERINLLEKLLEIIKKDLKKWPKPFQWKWEHQLSGQLMFKPLLASLI